MTVVSLVTALGLAGSAALAATKLAPPVITEHFTTLPCNKNTTIGMEGCAERLLLAADHRLNDQVVIVFGLFHSKGQKATFVAAETSWFTYRGTDCQSYAAIFEGGSIAPVAYANCEVQVDKSRSQDLHSFYEELTQGQGSNVPAWP